MMTGTIASHRLSMIASANRMMTRLTRPTVTAITGLSSFWTQGPFARIDEDPPDRADAKTPLVNRPRSEVASPCKGQAATLAASSECSPSTSVATDRPPIPARPARPAASLAAASSTQDSVRCGLHRPDRKGVGNPCTRHDTATTHAHRLSADAASTICGSEIAGRGGSRWRARNSASSCTV